MSRRTGDGYMFGVEKIQITHGEGSSLGVQEIDKQLVICKYKKCPHEGHKITENNAKMASCKPQFTYLVHTDCECGNNDFNGNKCFLCKGPPHYDSVKLNPVQMPTEKKQSIWRKFLKRLGSVVLWWS